MLWIGVGTPFALSGATLAVDCVLLANGDLALEVVTVSRLHEQLETKD